MRGISTSKKPSTLNDASGLNETPIFKHIVLRQDPGEALVVAIRSEISEARREGRPVNVGAARHSMGGQSIPRNGHALTYENSWLEPDIANETVQVHAGARWRDVIARLDPLGYGPKIMQSDHDFGVAGTFGVNAHGWAVPMAPMGSSVRSFALVLPDGQLATCSRTENADLFGMTMGGYGLTGAIIKMELDIARNLRLDPLFTEMPAAEFGDHFVNAANSGGVNMAYGRLSVDRANFFEKALMVTYRPSRDQRDLPNVSGPGAKTELARRFYRAQIGSNRARRMRWLAETKLGPLLGGRPVTRNSLINEPVAALEDRNPRRTDNLQEYFVPPDRFGEFLDLCKSIIPASNQEFLNLTLRFVDKDRESWLAYAPQPRISAVMSFSQKLSPQAESSMAAMTQEIIEGVLAMGGSYYLAYRPHARCDQFMRAYPRVAEFAAAKRQLDPDTVFQNNFWTTYLANI